MAKLTQEDFLRKAKNAHGDKYDYSKSEYVGAREKIEIICPIEGHGPFWQIASEHTCGKGCIKCGYISTGNYQKITKEDFLKRAKEAQSKKGREYDYSKLVYVDTRVKVEIICLVEEHGSFWQSPDNHMKGVGCPLCAHSKPLNTATFIEKANKIHNNKYDYSSLVYTKAKEKVEIICPVEGHGSFWQMASEHVCGTGCPKCGIDRANDSIRLTPDDFLERSKEEHKDKYDYSLVKYVDSKKKVEIICPIDGHGSFLQTPSAHMCGQGCPKCVSTRSSKVEEKWLDFMSVPQEFRNHHMKIKGRKFCVDGIDYDKNIIYEFYGNFFHGNPEIYDQDEYCNFLKNTYGELYRKTMDKENYILENSEFTLVTIWEKDFREKLRSGEIIIK